MPCERYFTQASLKTKQVVLSQEESHHLLKVMRTRCGDSIEVVNGMGDLAKATLIKEDRQGALLQIEELFHEEPPYPRVIIAQAIPKANRLDLIIEKGCELGAYEFWLFASEKSEKKVISHNLLSHLEAILIAALKQCGRLYLPKIRIVEKLHLNEHSFFGDPNGEIFHFDKSLKEIIFTVGPERGFSSEEVARYKAQGALGVKIHPNILRTDTASLAFLSIVNFLGGFHK